MVLTLRAKCRLWQTGRDQAKRARSSRALSHKRDYGLNRYRRTRVTASQFGRIAFRERVYQFLMEIVVTSSDRRRDPLVVHLTRAIDVFAKSIVNVALITALADLLFVIKLDFGNQQTREAACVVVQTALFIVDFNRQIRLRHAVAARAPQRRAVLVGKHRRFDW